jgi:Zn-finger nucleic acid-binding protein
MDIKTDEAIIKCPKCNVDMTKLTNGKYVIDKCPQCGGIFLDKDEIDAAHKVGFVTYVKDYFRRDKK